MKLLLLTIHSDPTIHPGSMEGGGTNLYINELIDLLMFRNIEVLLITRKSSPGKDFIQYGSVNIVRIEIGPQGHWEKDNLIGLEELINVKVINQLEKYDFIPTLIHSVYWFSGRCANNLSKLYNIPYIHTIISNGKRKLNSGYKVNTEQITWEEKVFFDSDILISISEEEKDDLIRLYKDHRSWNR
jgi:D-inositol-3-phosphate glycosyltransferase